MASVRNIAAGTSGTRASIQILFIDFLLLTIATAVLAAEIPRIGSRSISAKLVSPTGVATDTGGNIYVTESAGNRLLVYDRYGNSLREVKGLNKPTGVAVDSGGRIYISNTGRKAVDVYKRDLTPLFRLGLGMVELVFPTSIALDSSGNAYVADSKDHRIKVFDDSGSFLYSFGGQGTGNGNLNFPVAVAVNESAGEVIVTDLQPTLAGYRGAGVHVFSRSGAFQRRFGGYGEGQGLFVRPMGVAVDGSGRIYVSDAYQNVIQVFDAGGNFLLGIYDPAHPVRTPMGIAYCGKTDRLVVASLNTSRVEVFDADPDGSGEAVPLSFFSSGGGGGGCSMAGNSRAGDDSIDGSPFLAGILLYLWRRRMKRRAGISIIFLMAVILAASEARSMRLYPHIDMNGAGCTSCHTTHSLAANVDLLPAWAFQTPVNIDDTPHNNLCRHCHNDIEAPFVKTHSSISTDNGYGDWSMECRACHDPHVQRQYRTYGSSSVLSSGTVSSVSDNILNASGMGWSDNQYREFVVIPNASDDNNVYRVGSNGANTLYIDGPMDLSRVAAGNTFRIVLGKLVKSTVATPSSGNRTVRFFRESGTNSFADGDGTTDGICQVCHTQTAHHRNNGSDAGSHSAAAKCTNCHTHANGFKGSAGGSHTSHAALLTCESGNMGCHGSNSPPLMSDGQNLANTTRCNTCHSPGGTYDGVNDSAIGCKANWSNGTSNIYSGGVMISGKEKWCAGCHDESPSVINGVSAPNVVGSEAGYYGYGQGWGYYKTGHGLASGVYPASQEPAANLSCDACHDATATHIDNNQRTYGVADDNYQAGYRLRRPMDIPRTDSGEPVSDFQLCVDCHSYDTFLNSSNFTTNFRNGTTVNEHWRHLQAPTTGQFAGGGWWDSDWDGTGDSKINCPACHNVHGSPSPRMLQHGELISTPGTTDKVPSINVRYTPYTPDAYPILANSTGGQLNPTSQGGGSVANTGVCSMCHGNNGTYTRTPTDMPPRIRGVYGKTGSNVLAVVFTEGVYTNSGASGALAAGDFAYTDADNGRTVSGVSHTAGDVAARLTLSSALDSSNDIGVDTLAAATSASIYDGASQAMGTTPVVVSGDTTAPSIADWSPAPGAADVGIQSNITLSLLDGGSGVDWTTFSITLSGDKGYSATYTDLDTSVVSKTGTPAGYAVTVNPGADFSYGEVITATVAASDLVGNAMSPSVWSFTTISGGTPQTMTLHPTDNAYSGIFSATGGTWAAVLDTDDGDSTRATSTTGSGYSVNPTSRFVVNMDDPSGIGGATIQNFTIHVLARYVTGGGGASSGTMRICYTTNNGVNTVCTGDLSVTGSGYADFATATATTDSAGGALDLTDINNLQVEVRRMTSGSYILRVTEVKVDITYVP